MAATVRRNGLCGRRISTHALSALDAVVRRPQGGHVAVVGTPGTGKSTAAAQRVLWLDTQSDRRVLALSARSGEDAKMATLLDRELAFYALERRGHNVSSVMEWTQRTLEELGHQQRVLPFDRLTAFLMHHIAEIPLERFHHRLTTPSSVHFRRSVADMLRFFNLLEAHYVTPAAYESFAGTNEETTAHLELAHAYRVYRELLQRHHLASWDSCVVDLLELLSKDPHYLSSVTNEFTDVVVDELERLTPAMVQLIGTIVRETPELQSSTTFSETIVADQNETTGCPRTEQLKSLLETSDASIKWDLVQLPPTTTQVPVLSFANAMLSSGGKTKRSKTKKQEFPSVPFPVESMEFATMLDEAKGIAQNLKERLVDTGIPPSSIKILCPTRADVTYITQILQEEGVPVQGGRQVSSTGSSSSLLFEEPGVNGIFSLLVALCCPSDTKHLYNVLRSDYLSLAPDVLSRIMERYHREATHACLLEVLQTIVDTNGNLLAATSEAEVASNTQAVERIRQFLDLLSECREACHIKTVQELVQLFLERTNFLSRVLDPDSSKDARDSIALADFLREIETAQRIVESPHVPFVVPYLLQLQSARFSVTEDADSEDVDNGVVVLPLSRYSLDKLDHEELGECKLLVLMAMRDSKFPGRMKRITWPLPTSLLQTPLPIQTRPQFLLENERLVYETIVRTTPERLVLSYALAASSVPSKKPEKLSCVLSPLWNHAESLDQPANLESTPSAASPPSTSAPSKKSPVATPASTMLSPYEPSHLSYSQMSEYQRCPQRYYLSRVLGLRTSSQEGETTPAMMYGRSLHEAIAALAQCLQEGKAVEAATSEAFEVLEGTWQRAGFLSRRQEGFFFAQAREALSRFIQNDNSSAEILHIEEIFECRLPGSDIEIRGVWDRIDRRRSDGAVIIREFKSNPSGQARPNLDLTAAQSLQLKLYMVAYEQIHGVAPHGASLEIIGGGDGSVGFLPYSPDLLDEVLEVVTSTIESLRRGSFPATPDFMTCSMCPYATSVCRASKEVATSLLAVDGDVDSDQEERTTSTASVH
ncbi:hypothetical protein Poli38472_012467 [Pythium oligandrum]|uniref:DNA 3'-5' helicase n=1 Tax=Pythium oligandrum TaxID=41045 RepID=A0A8K1FLP0_PYTOL|nr:hypothetical protein Poli38472_012467 [Pythium oligandrum]|eukprot:TMW67351.1 hypothetical protein Poli38472_012467 [Pythium oligandrum]